jgi:hypothetical protein
LNTYGVDCTNVQYHLQQKNLVFEKGILTKRKRLEVDWASHATQPNKSQTERAHSKGFLPPHTKTLQASASISTMSREGECSLARAHGEFDASKKDTMDVFIRPSLEAKMACVHNLKELLNLELKVASVDILALNEETMTTQADLIAAQSEVLRSF